MHDDCIKFSVADREWLISQFDSVKQHHRRIEEQNRILTGKLDLLIKRTGGADFTTGMQSGSKRPRGMEHGNLLDTAQASFHGSTGSQSQDPDGSFKSFIDMVLENSNEEHKTIDGGENFGGVDAQPQSFHRRDSHSAVASILNSLGSETANPSCDPVNMPQVGTEWIPRANHFENKATGPAPIFSSQVAPPITSSSTSIDPDVVPEWVAVIPTARSTSSERDCPARGDEEEGALMDMTLVSAHLVESIGRGITIENNAAQMIADQRQHARQLSKRVMWAIAALIFAVIVSLTSTIIITHHEAPELAPYTHSTPDDKFVDSNDYVQSYENEVDKKENDQIPDLPINEVASTSSSTSDSYGDLTSSKYTGNDVDSLPSDESSHDSLPSEGLRRWKNWDIYPPWETKEHTRTAPHSVSKIHIFDRHLTEPYGGKKNQLTKDLRSGHSSYSEISLRMNGQEADTLFYCYRQI